MPSKCKHPECKSDASYNFPDKKGRVFCKKHTEPGMVTNRVDSRRCIHPSHGDNAPRASFNFPDEKKPLWCKEHSQDGMINFVNKNNKCVECNITQPSFGLKGNSKPTHCAKCKSPEMVDMVSNLCDYEDCRKNATFGIPDNKATRCKFHMLPTMIDVKNSKCKECSKQPTFGITKPTHCISHKTPEMVDLRHSTEICQECTTRATYSLSNRPTHCGKHKTDDMKDVVSDMCQECGLTQPIFGYDTDTKTKFCKNCKKNDMKDIQHNMCIVCDSHQPTFNYKGVKPATHCCGCALDRMVDVINPMCTSCQLFVVPKKPHLCEYCKPASTRREKTKEMEIVNFLTEKGYEFKHNKSTGFACGNYRPDVLIDGGSHFVVVEIDEGQHIQYDQRCEVARMGNIYQSLGLPCIFLRYNPDVVRYEGRVSIVHTVKRLECLEENIDKYLESVPETEISVYRLFYNNDEGEHLQKFDITEYISTLWEEQVIN